MQRPRARKASGTLVEQRGHRGSWAQASRRRPLLGCPIAGPNSTSPQLNGLPLSPFLLSEARYQQCHHPLPEPGICVPFSLYFPFTPTRLASHQILPIVP